jgi:leucyl-tRNA synthetase
VNHLTKQLTATGSVPREAVEPLVLMVAPLAPHLAEELWVRLGRSGGVSRVAYPVADPELLKAEQVTCVVQVKGKVRHRIEVDPEISEADLEEAVMAEPRVQELLAGQTVRKVIVRAPKIVNIVV